MGIHSGTFLGMAVSFTYWAGKPDTVSSTCMSNVLGGEIMGSDSEFPV